ncbi:FadR/GntR family transcriptional regulator [Paenibacillus sp. LHD-117]|uniref:FadR/GntR family transcriptional regulator n=1 Tax=Paenibacillus sp. LHD-117 TaxID=3071412 RepID=UPI0027E081A4|nr:FadR/GntR family transcriptional regulator [Paenibacillus sp. LHD-117]MDQ6420648.1 FadR/GntR family transcriptional regulator [Paenibacillus sp. LHD-117]
MKIETEKGHEIVSRVLLTKIREGEWDPGAKLPSVVELSQQFGVGRSTVREALSALKATGWLDIRHGGGTFVKKILPTEAQQGGMSLFQEADSILELLEVRKIVEAGASAFAAERRDERDLAKLQAILDRMEHALRDNDTVEGERADVAFHKAIAESSRNTLLIQLMDSLTQRLGETIGKTRELWFYQQKSTAERLLEEHRHIYGAIQAGDAGQATALIHEHLFKVESVLRASIPASD